MSTWEVRTPCELDPLFETEEPHVARAVEKRRREFQAGRHCARRALSALGVAPEPIVPGADRAPSWPLGCVGSITHTGDLAHGFAAAAVARARDVQAVGIDAELNTPLQEELRSRILRVAEERLVDSFPTQRRGSIAKLFFSAKEAFYKCQYLLSEQYLGFHDVEVDLDFGTSRFRASLLKQAGQLPVGTVFDGRFIITDELIVTGAERAQPR